MHDVFQKGKPTMDAYITVGRLKCALKGQLEDYDPSFGNYDQLVVSPDAFDWNQIMADPESPDGRDYDAVCPYVYISLSLSMSVDM